MSILNDPLSAVLPYVILVLAVLQGLLAMGRDKGSVLFFVLGICCAGLDVLVFGFVWSGIAVIVLNVALMAVGVGLDDARCRKNRRALTADTKTADRPVALP